MIGLEKRIKYFILIDGSILNGGIALQKMFRIMYSVNIAQHFNIKYKHSGFEEKSLDSFGKIDVTKADGHHLPLETSSRYLEYNFFKTLDLILFGIKTLILCYFS
jgi:hypothetical protein